MQAIYEAGLLIAPVRAITRATARNMAVFAKPARPKSEANHVDYNNALAENINALYTAE